MSTGVLMLFNAVQQSCLGKLPAQQRIDKLVIWADGNDVLTHVGETAPIRSRIETY
jgi:hypothetical protein